MSFDKLKTYILENEFKLVYLNNKVNIVNYSDIGHFDNNKIIVYNSQQIITINGHNLVISKLLKDELLIEGRIERIDIHE